MGTELQRDVAASGVRLRVSEWGPGEQLTGAREDSTPVVLLHGLLANRLTWKPLAEHLASERRIVATDLPGFGDSEKPGPNRYPYGIEAFSEAVADLFGGLGIGRAHLVGHALGGAVALRVAARHPELVSRLVLVDTLCYPSPLDPKLRLALTPLLGGLLFKQLLGRGAFRALYRDRIAPGADGARLDAYYDSLNSPAGRGALLATLRATLDTRAVVADSRRIQVPTLVLWGRHDRVYPASFGRRLAKEIPNAGFDLLDSGHAPQEESPRDVSRILRRFFEGKRAGAR